jgi:hypothetical protein
MADVPAGGAAIRVAPLDLELALDRQLTVDHEQWQTIVARVSQDSLSRCADAGRHSFQ